VVKCPFCGFGNEEGALFCEQCKSDVSNVAPAAAPTIPLSEPTPPAAVVVEEAPVMAAIVEDTPAAVAIIEETPVLAAIVEEPIAADLVQEPALMIAEAPPPGPMMAAGEAMAPEMVPAAVVAEAMAPAKPAATGTPIPAGATVKLIVQRGLKVGEEYSVFPGENFIGRADEKPVDVDLTFQEPEDRVWCSRQHALLNYDDAAGMLTIEDLNSSNGTFVNRERVYPGQPKQLFIGSTIQIGTVHMKVKV
jgi:FHA domain